MNAPPQNVVDLASAAAEYVLRATKLELDHTPETLPFLDHYVRTTMQQTEGSKKVALGPAEAIVAHSLGAYFGEVVRTALDDGEWHFGETPEETRLRFTRCPLEFNPMGVALEAISEDGAEGWGAHFQTPPTLMETVEASLASMGEVRESDYYRFTTRFEALQQVYELLAGLGRGPAGSA